MSNKKLKRAVIKEELVALTGDYIKALILNQFIYWSERTNEFDQFITEERKRDPDTVIDLSHGWIYKKADELIDELMLNISANTMRRHLKSLIEVGYLYERNNPKHKWDRILQYRPDMVKIQVDLHKLGFALADYPLIHANVILKEGTSTVKVQTLQNDGAIPETTTETTNRDISLEKKSIESEPFSQTQSVDRSRLQEGIVTVTINEEDDLLNVLVYPLVSTEEQEGESPLVSVFDSDGSIIPEMRDILVKMSSDGLVDHRSYENYPDWTFFHWVDNGLPVKNIPYGIAEKYGYELPEIYGPQPQVLAKYASEVAKGAAEALDKEITGKEDELANVFGENPRQAEIDKYQNGNQRLSKDELLLASMGAGVSGEIRSVLASIRDRGWQVRDERVEMVLGQFFEITGFEIPSNKAQRKLFEVGARDHLDETLFEGRISELYKAVWDKVAEDVQSGDLELTHPRAFTKMMYGAVNREAGRDMNKGPAGGLTRQQVLHVFQNEGLVEVKEVEGTGKHDFFWTETGEPVGKKLPRNLINKYVLSKSSVQTENPGAR